MNRRILCLSATLALLLVGNAGTSVADHPSFEDLKNRDWFALRDINDAGRLGETAVYMKVVSADDLEMKARIWIYKKGNKGHERKPGILVKGAWLKSNSKRCTARLYKGSKHVASLTYWLDTGSQGTNGKRLRVMLRFVPKVNQTANAPGDGPTDYAGHCDDPPDDDILEEEPPIDGAPTSDFGATEDPYPDPAP